MWEPDLPDESDHIRQGDLLSGQPMPSRGTLELTATGMKAGVKPSVFAVALDRCCTVENRLTIMLASVGRAADKGPEHGYSKALRSSTAAVGQPYAYYEHLLEPLAGHLDPRPGEFWIIKLLERVSVAVKSHDHFADLRSRRVARMTPLERARLRAKLTVHWGRAEDDDAGWLAANGYDTMGRPAQP